MDFFMLFEFDLFLFEMMGQRSASSLGWVSAELRGWRIQVFLRGRAISEAIRQTQLCPPRYTSILKKKNTHVAIFKDELNFVA